MHADEDDQETDLVDVSHLSLADLLSADGTVLAQSLRRLLHEVDLSAEAISAWTSFAR